jgi:pyrroloquinoline quinone (PQQ) biosynthesis protein C
MNKDIYYDQVIQEAANTLLAIPILNKLSDLSRDQLHYLFSQIYYFVDLFPGLLGILLWKINDERIRFAIIDNLVDECGGIEKIRANDHSATHSRLLLKFIATLSKSDVPLANKSVNTERLINDFNGFFINSTPVEVMAAMASMEGMSTQWFGLIYQQLLARKAFSQDDLYFFELHTGLDEVHGNILKEVLMPLLKDEKSFILLRNGVMRSISIWKCFYEALTREMEVIYS